MTAPAQTATATLSGVVQDENGAVVPNASVTVSDPARGLKRNTTTNGEGQFTVSLLLPSTYTVTVEQTGFAKMLVNDVVLNVADSRQLAIQLQVKQKEEVVTVDAADVSVRVDAGGLGTVIDREFVGGLPNNGRNFSTLALLTPGVTLNVVAGFDLGQLSVNGQRASANAVTIDGISGNIGMGTSATGAASATSLALSGAYPGNSAQGGTNNLVSQDALQEFKVQTSGYTAESGRQPGAQIQVVTRSGDNRYRGSIFDYLRNEALDARNYFNTKPAPQAALRQNQFGGTFSGPLPFLHFGDGGGSLFRTGKDRTFFFFSYEGQKLQLPTSGTIAVPSLRLRQLAANSPLLPILNFFPTPTGAETTTSTACSPGPTCGPNGFRYSGVAPYAYSTSNSSELDATSIRIDHRVNNSHTIFGRFNESPSYSSAGTIVRFSTVSSTRTFTVGATSVLGKGFTNELRFNYSKQRSAFDRELVQFGNGVPFDSELITPATGTANFILNPANNASFVIPSLIVGPSADSYQRQVNIVDNVTFATGAHQFKVGVDFRRLSPLFGPQNSEQFQFLSENAIVNAAPSSYRIDVREPVRPQFDSFSAYLQDTWKASRRLTLDLGLRWELNPAPTEADGKLPRTLVGMVGNDVSHATVAPEGTPFYKTFYTAFAPRFGAAYQLFQTPGRETVLRGGFGIYYDLGSGLASAGWPFTAMKFFPTNHPQYPECVAPIRFPISPTCSTLPTIAPATISTFTVAEDLKLPYTLQWNFSVEQAMSKGQVLSASYVGSAGRRLLAYQALNLQPRDPVSGDLLPKPNPNLGFVSFASNGPTSDYNALQVQYRARLKNQIQALVNYTWSHAIDEASADISPAVFDRGDASFDVRHNFSAALHFAIPTFKFGGPITEYLSKDWSLDAIAYAQSGRPINVLAGSTLALEGNAITTRPNLVLGVPIYIDDPLNGGGRRLNRAAFALPLTCVPVGAPNCVPRVVGQGSLGRNSVRGYGMYQLDVALGRTFTIRESLRLQLKGEVFNLLNHPMFADTDNPISSGSTFGDVTRTLNTGLGGLSSLYQLGGPRSIQLSARLSF
jgi:hypothetical protein